MNKAGMNCPLAIETSGHAALRENYFLDDGAFLVTKIIIKSAQLRSQGKTLEDLLTPLEEPVEALEIRFPILEENFRECGEKIIADLTEYAKKGPNGKLRRIIMRACVFPLAVRTATVSSSCA